MWPRGQRIMWQGWVLLNISHHPAKFDGHRHYAREDILFFICDLTWQTHVLRESRDIMGEFISS